MHPTKVQNDIDDGDDEVQKNSDDYESEESDNVLREDSMQLALQDLDYDNDEGGVVQANNEYVEPIDPHPDKLEGDDWVNSACVEHITSEFSRF